VQTLEARAALPAATSCGVCGGWPPKNDRKRDPFRSLEKRSLP
jgi:hypothetical protein